MGLRLKPDANDWWLLRGIFYGAMSGALVAGLYDHGSSWARIYMFDAALTGAFLGLIWGLLVARRKRQESERDHTHEG